MFDGADQRHGKSSYFFNLIRGSAYVLVLLLVFCRSHRHPPPPAEVLYSSWPAHPSIADLLRTDDTGLVLDVNTTAVAAAPPPQPSRNTSLVDAASSLAGCFGLSHALRTDAASPRTYIPPASFRNLLIIFQTCDSRLVAISYFWFLPWLVLNACFAPFLAHSTRGPDSVPYASP